MCLLQHRPALVEDGAGLCAGAFRPEARVLDLCCGTEIWRCAPAAGREVLSQDSGRGFSLYAMLQRASGKSGSTSLQWVEPMLCACHFLMTISICASSSRLRNLANYDAGLREMHVCCVPAECGILDFAEPRGVWEVFTGFISKMCCPHRHDYFWCEGSICLFAHVSRAFSRARRDAGAHGAGRPPRGVVESVYARDRGIVPREKITGEI